MSTKNVNRPAHKETSEVWDRFPLSDVAEIIVSNVDKKTKSGELSIRLCNYTDVYYNSHIRSDMDFMRASATAAEIERFAIKKNDVLITKDSETPGDIAVPALITEDLPGVICGYHLAILRPNPKRLDGGYLSSLLRLQTMRQYFFTLANGVTRFGLSIDAIANAEVPLPPLPKQRQIAAILSTWDRAIEQTQKLLDACRRRKQALMQKLLTGAWRFPEFGKPAKNGELPEGWFEMMLGNLGGTYAGLSGKSKKDFGQGKPYIPYLNIFSNTSIDKSQMDYVQIYSNEKQNPVRYGDIFFTTSSETPDEVGMSSVLLFHPVSAMYLNSFCFGFRLHDFSLVLPEFAAFLFRGNEFRSSIFALAQGATRYNLSKIQLLQLLCTLPPLLEQKKITAVLTAVDAEIAALRKSLEQLQRQKRGLMQKLLTGTVRV